jgi:hypothetical protein
MDAGGVRGGLMAVTMTIYPSWKDKMGEAANLASDTFKVVLLNNSHAYNAVHDELADITANQLSTANGFALAGSVIGAYVFGAAWEDISMRRTDGSHGGYGSSY